MRRVRPAPVSPPECGAVVVAAAAQAADPGAPAAMPGLARVSSADRPAPWGPAFIAFTAAGPGQRGKDAGSRCCPAEVACGVWLASCVWRRACHVRFCWYVALRCAGSVAAAKPGPASVGHRSGRCRSGRVRRDVLGEGRRQASAGLEGSISMGKYVLAFRGQPGRAAAPEEEQAWGAWFGQLGLAITDMGNRVGATRPLPPARPPDPRAALLPAS